MKTNTLNLQEIASAFRERRYDVSIFDDCAAARDYLCRVLCGKSIGIGDSMTIHSMGLYNELCARGEDVVSPMYTDDFLAGARECVLTDVFLCSVNAATIQGELLNMDGTGNRVAGSLFGHKKVYFIIGRNKFCDSIEKAVNRIRQVAAPMNAKRLGKRTPCAVTGHCADCSSPDRICNALTIHWKKMSNIEMEIVLIDEDLGL